MAYPLHWKWNLKKKTWELRLNWELLKRKNVWLNASQVIFGLCFNSKMNIFNLVLHHWFLIIFRFFFGGSVLPWLEQRQYTTMPLWWLRWGDFFLWAQQLPEQTILKQQTRYNKCVIYTGIAKFYQAAPRDFGSTILSFPDSQSCHVT